MVDSILTVTVPATFRSLTNLDRVKMDLGIVDSTNDDLFETLISEATAKCETYCNRVFATETLQQTFRLPIPDSPYSVFNAPPIQFLELGRYPVQSITSVIVDGATLTGVEYEVDLGTGFLYRLDAGDNRTPWRFRKCVVTFVAGYKLPDQIGRNLPADVESACLILVKHRWFGRQRDPLIKAQTIPQVIETQYWVGGIAGTDGDISPEVSGLLDPYRSHGYLGV